MGERQLTPRLGLGADGVSAEDRVGSRQDPGALGWSPGAPDPGGGAPLPPGRGAGGPAHTAVWRRSEKTRSVKSASSPARVALGTTR